MMTGITGLHDAEDQLTRQIIAIKDERIKQLESIPGIGSLGSRVLLAALDTAERFDNKKAVAKTDPRSEDWAARLAPE